MSEAAPPITFPPISAIFLTHFDDIKGQSVIFYRGTADLPEGTIEHSSLPSGLHAIDEDLITFRHGDLPAVGLFRNRSTAREAPDGQGTSVDDLVAGGGVIVDGTIAGGSGAPTQLAGKRQGRGRRMATVGVVLPVTSTPAELFELYEPLKELYDRLESLSTPLEAFTSASICSGLLEQVWGTYGVKHHGGETSTGPGPSRMRGVERTSLGEEGRALRGLVNGSRRVWTRHPITYLPALLSILGPSIVTVYKAALSGQRILMYAQPPLAPLAAFAYCISAMSLPPPSVSTSSGGTTKWLGNVGLMELGDLKISRGSWVATTTDKILLSHSAAYDLSIDLSSSLHSSSTGEIEADADAPDPVLASTLPPYSFASAPSGPSGKAHAQAQAQAVSYTFGDIPLYKTLHALTTSPTSVTTEVNRRSASNGNETHLDTAQSSSSNTNTKTDTKRSQNQNQSPLRIARKGRYNTSTSTSWWLVFYDLVDNVWSLCLGVCEYAIGRGNVDDDGAYGNGSRGSRSRGQKGRIYLSESDYDHDEGEEDARLLGDGDGEMDGLLDADDTHGGTGVSQSTGSAARETLANARGRDGGDEDEGEDEDEALRQGRLILRQLYHNTYHLHQRLSEIRESSSIEANHDSELDGAAEYDSSRGELTESEVKALIGGSSAGGKRWSLGLGLGWGGKGGAEIRFWQGVARRWGFVQSSGSGSGTAD